jgi:hypothetical protein
MMTTREAAVFILRKKHPGESIDTTSEEFKQLVDELGNYDSSEATLAHQRRVCNLMVRLAQQIIDRAAIHDQSKLSAEEKPYFDRATPILKYLDYGTEEYHAALNDIKAALSHHYLHNRHHPEHFSDGIAAMNLVDLIEMICDWIAATERHQSGNIWESITHNSTRFGYDGNMIAILENTVRLFDDVGN